MNHRRRNDADCGFTLVEILAVLAILGLVMSLAIFSFGKQTERANEVKTRTTMEEIATKITSWETRKGGPPPDSLARLKIKSDNDLNECAEALYAALHGKDYPEGTNVTDEYIKNTDDDTTPTPYHRDAGVSKLLEVVDAWDNPIAYFPASSYSETRRANIRMGDPEDPNDPDQQVSPMKSSVTGGWANADTYQLISAGTDRRFGTEDDVTNFKK